MTLFADSIPVDLDVRERIRTDVGRNLFVEAGAGTGKTKVLVDRVVHLIATGAIGDVGGLVAITFTEAAAAELRDRIRNALQDGAESEGRPADERERCAAARRAIDTATITTLHGFAQRILAEHPLDAGLAPTFAIDDDVQSRVRFVERWTAFRDELFADPSAADDLRRMYALGLNTDRWRDIARVLHQRWDALVGVELPGPALPLIDVTGIIASIEQGDEAAQARWPADGDHLTKLVEQWRALRAALIDADTAGDELEVLRLLQTSLAKPSTQGRKEVWGQETKVAVLDPLVAANDARGDVLQRVRTGLMQRMLPRLQAFTLAGVEDRRARAVLEFHDLLVHARNLLRDHRDIRIAVANQIDVILIDEFQDTDPLQLDIAFMLAAADPGQPPAAWEDTELRAGKLLVVGDPKQSIYRFRGADIGLWDRTKACFPEGVEQLGQNFRTVPPLLEWVNRVFATVIAGGAPGAQPAYHELSAFRPEVREGPAVVVVGEPHAKARASELREVEARELAQLILAIKVDGWEVEEGSTQACRRARFDDIAVLVPTRTPLTQLERALDALDVPYRVESRSLVWATDAVRELLAVLTAIDDPADDIAVVAALRSPGFACSDVDLVEWHLAGGRWDHTRDAPEGIDPEHPVAAAMAALGRYHGVRWERPVDLLVEEIIRERKLAELTFAQRRPRDHWRRLRFVLDQARAFVEAGGASLGDFVAWAQLQCDEGAMVVETPAPEPDDDAVRILTIHGSKGLEFPIVVLAGLSSAGNDTGPRVLYGEHGPEVSIGPEGARVRTPGYEALAERTGDADKFEGQRLLYVAATRARDHLVVGLHHQAGSRTPARELWDVCQGGAAGWWRPALLGDQLALPVEAAVPGFDPLTIEARDAWIEDHARLLERANARRVFAATAVAAAPDVDPDPIEPSEADDPTPMATAAPIRRGGTALGRAVHAALATIDMQDPERELHALASLHAQAERVEPDEVETRVRAALAAPTIIAARAGRFWREVAVAAPVGDRGHLVEGYIDLLFEDEDGGLVVVDYKTDATADVDAAAAGYELQLATYALAVEAAVGRPITRAVFVFCRPDGAVEREVRDLRPVIEEVVRVAG